MPRCVWGKRSHTSQPTDWIGRGPAVMRDEARRASLARKSGVRVGACQRTTHSLRVANCIESQLAPGRVAKAAAWAGLSGPFWRSFADVPLALVCFGIKAAPLCPIRPPALSLPFCTVPRAV